MRNDITMDRSVRPQIFSGVFYQLSIYRISENILNSSQEILISGNGTEEIHPWKSYHYTSSRKFQPGNALSSFLYIEYNISFLSKGTRQERLTTALAVHYRYLYHWLNADIHLFELQLKCFNME